MSLAVTAGGGPAAAGTARCSASVGGAPLSASGTRFTGGTATCTFAIPKNAKGKTITGNVSVTTGGGAVTKTFTARVR